MDNLQGKVCSKARDVRVEAPNSIVDGLSLALYMRGLVGRFVDSIRHQKNQVGHHGVIANAIQKPTQKVARIHLAIRLATIGACATRKLARCRRPLGLDARRLPPVAHDPVHHTPQVPEKVWLLRWVPVLVLRVPDAGEGLLDDFLRGLERAVPESTVGEVGEALGYCVPVLFNEKRFDILIPRHWTWSPGKRWRRSGFRGSKKRRVRSRKRRARHLYHASG